MAARKSKARKNDKTSRKKPAPSASKKARAKKKASTRKARSSAGSADVVYSDIRRSAGVLSRLLRIS